MLTFVALPITQELQADHQLIEQTTLFSRTKNLQNMSKWHPVVQCSILPELVQNEVRTSLRLVMPMLPAFYLTHMMLNTQHHC